MVDTVYYSDCGRMRSPSLATVQAHEATCPLCRAIRSDDK